jgi:restriction system protein
MSTASSNIPTPKELMWRVVLALRELGGSGTIQEIREKVAEIGGFDDQQLSKLHGKGPLTEIEYRVGWARWLLKAAGAITQSQNGVWALTDVGRSVSESDMARLYSVSRTKQHTAKAKSSDTESPDDQVSEGDDANPQWREALLERVLMMDPSSFEQLAARLLREKGFTSVSVTGRTGDGGIDGVGVLRVSLINFKVFFQCKRYKGSVGSSVIRDFRGAMAGRADKGLLITTGSFSRDAKAEATRDGAPPVDLIDGDDLCELLKETKLGIRTREATTVDEPFFSSFGRTEKQEI